MLSGIVAGRRSTFVVLLFACGLVGVGWGLGSADPAAVKSLSHWPAPGAAEEDAFAAASLRMEAPVGSVVTSITMAQALDVVEDAGFPKDMEPYS